MPEDEAYLHNVLSSIQEREIRSRTPLPRSHTQDRLLESYKERKVPSVPEPAWHKPADNEIFSFNAHGVQEPNIDYIRHHFLREGRITESQALYILNEATALLTKEQNLLEVDGPITVCGDVHGQYIFEVGGDPTTNTYLFLGDYVDRGCFGIECLLFLYSIKIRYPSRIYLLRGNHECRHLTEYFTFHRECTRKYSLAVYEACIRSFCALPLAALLDNRFLCVHGGISPELNMLSDINMISRFQEPPSHGLLCDLLWADPIANFGHEQEPSSSNAQGGSGHPQPPVPAGTSFVHNPVRGCSFFYTYDAAVSFLDRNNLLGIIRGHEVQQSGYNMYRKTPHKKFPSVITIFSAPNYCDFYHNRGAVLKYVNKNITIRQYNASAHPYWLPNFMDAFTWSLPFVGDKIVQMLLAILSCCTAEELEESSDEDVGEGARARELTEQADERRQAIKAKILAVGRMRKVFQLLREESETASELNQAMEASGMAAVSARAGRDELGVQTNQIRRQIRSFDDAHRADEFNERLPNFTDSASASGASTPAIDPETGLPLPPQRRPTFPLVQAPSMRRHASYQDNIDLEARFRRLMQPAPLPHAGGLGDGGAGAGVEADEEEDEDERELRALADRIALGKRAGQRPQALRRHGTV